MISHIVLLCSLAHTQLLVNELHEQLTAEYGGLAYVTDQGFTWTHRHGFLVIEWQTDTVDEDLLGQLEQDERVKDLLTYQLPTDEDAVLLFGSVQAHDRGEVQ